MVTLEEINTTIVSCSKCPRLSAYINDVSQRKVKRYRNWTYWGKPVPSFGDPEAKLVIVGLAPAAHGGNRTGRMFTGDRSGQWLFRALYEIGFSNKNESISRDDGVQVRGVYITAVVHCAPPKNKPLKEEVNKCSTYLKEELELLKRARVYLTLGSVAFSNTTKILGVKGKFYHGAKYSVGERLIIASYHPSAQNTNTGKLTWNMWISLFMEIKSILDKT
ncbi:uracil-DNA glycosylase [Sulfolobales archaeon HS-7]|nr:uracil-DNA glycosylase [Sulfolobales archaeon HS-7]